VLRGLGLGAAAALGGCGHRTAAGGQPTPSPATQRIPSATPRGQLPPATPWRARSGEVKPEVKARATQLLQLVGTWSDGRGDPGAAGRRLGAAGYNPGLAARLDFLTPNAAAATTLVTDAQYGGILSDSASVLIPVVQWYSAPDGSVVRHGSTFDVRLSRSGSEWTVTEIHPAAPGPPAGNLSASANAVLANDRIRLTDSARADVVAGQVHDSVLDALQELARRNVLDVSVLRSGHPLLVFGTDRPSDHPYGRAADVWAIDGATVVDPANRDVVTAFMRAAARTGPWQVGGPVLPDGGNMFFSDDTHHDHVHMGFHT